MSIATTRTNRPVETGTRIDAPGPPAEAAAVRFHGISKSFGSSHASRTVLEDIDIKVAPGEIVAILGPSGCGKSTLLRAAAGLDHPSAGQVEIDGREVRGIGDRSAVAFQEPRLLPWRSVRSNVDLGLPRGLGRSEARGRVQELLELVELDQHAGLRPREISGGMAQRVSLARALARRPGVLLLDEPFGALDALTRLKMQDLLLEIHRARPTTILLVTHDVDEALQLADRIIVLGRTGDGPAATVSEEITVPMQRPRERTGTRLAPLRERLLACLGVDIHRR
ncbi:ABC transporter ATP-binding protein [Arthrobacter rhombi]|uniref:ABC transporter ATP-binding protein n=1 Tax=Arthrobacter rhombi TaxID=71253 RepID=UPI003FD53B36